MSFLPYASVLGVTAASKFHALAEELDAVYNYRYDTHLHPFSHETQRSLFFVMLFSSFVPILVRALCSI